MIHNKKYQPLSWNFISNFFYEGSRRFILLTKNKILRKKISKKRIKIISKRRTKRKLLKFKRKIHHVNEVKKAFVIWQEFNLNVSNDIKTQSSEREMKKMKKKHCHKNSRVLNDMITWAYLNGAIIMFLYMNEYVNISFIYHFGKKIK